MGLNKQDQKGFSAFEAILLLIIVGLIGFIGWYVWHTKQTTNKIQTTAPSNTSKTTKNTVSKPVVTDPTLNWVAYNSRDGSFSLKYPKAWATATNPDLCSDNVLLLGPDANSVGKCGSDNAGEVEISASSIHGCFPLDDSYSSQTKETITVSGVAGTKYTGVANGNQNSGLGGQPAGTKVIQYCFSTPAMTYSAGYTQQPGFADGASDFNLIVTKTLKFNK